MTHPYDALDDTAFWRTGVAAADPAAMHGIYVPKVRIGGAHVATAGSCFAQHVGRALRQAGVAVLDAEPPPFAMPDDLARRFGYGLFSARYGNVYSVLQLEQLLEDARTGRVDPAEVWERDGRFFDAMRPGVEPDGLDSPEEALALRHDHLARVAAMLAQTEIFVFTLGLTEVWTDRLTGRAYPLCPGIVAGRFDPARHRLHNMTMPEVVAGLKRARARLLDFRPGMRMILTVSPVPLTATAAGGHVLAATTWSKAVLRAAAGEMAAEFADVDYFPSYEIVTNPAAQGRFFGPNLRSVTAEGVTAVMRVFLAAQGLAEAEPARAATSVPDPDDPEAGQEAICEDILLDPGRG